MQKFMCSHTWPSGAFSREQVCQLADAAQHDDQVKGYRSFVSLSAGKAFCILEAKDRESLANWFQRMGLPFDEIVPVELEGERGTICDLTAEPQHEAVVI